ncbi:MAG: AI-2E family transporter [Methylophilaceae bacterium]
MDKVKLSSMAVVLLMIFANLQLHLVPAAFCGMLIYLLTSRLGNVLSRHISRKYLSEHQARLLAAVLMVLIIVGVLTLLTMFLSRTLGSEENLSGLAAKVGEVLSDLRGKLPPTLVTYLPESLLELKETAVALLKEHGKELSTVGKESLHTFAHILIALAIGVMLSLQRLVPLKEAKPLAVAMRSRFTLLSKAFENVVFAQVKISAINTVLTGIFLLVILPLAGIHLPYSKTLVIITFFVGLLPIVGNLISNTLIVVIALGLSFQIAVSALIFLIAVHKLEYFINAKIVGDRIQAAAWELLLSMLVMETIFGIWGLLLAPIIYAYIKSELMQSKLI